jgi:DNA helicase II / ATP-dependent DNA helicase PcrA
MNSPSPEQQKAIDQTGKFVLHASPGSGKTFTVACRLANKIKNWNFSSSGIATISFTNVASEEISKNLEGFGLPPDPGYPHFLGTIDHFINKWIFLPYGHLVMGCESRPNIVGLYQNVWVAEEHKFAGWIKPECHRCNITKFTYGIDGNLIGGIANCPYEHEYCLKKKQKFNRLGYALISDAEFWAMRVLENYPSIAKALTRRFPEIIIDEAQDTSNIQMRIIDLLVDNGLSNIMLVGDPDQAIFEWRDADPDIFESKINNNHWGDTLFLTENYRSSQLICNFTRRFSAHLSQASIAKGEVKDYSFSPFLLTYNSDSLLKLKNDFIAFCILQGLDISPSSIAMLFRAKRMLNKLLGVEYEESTLGALQYGAIQ